METTSWVDLEPHSPDYFFVPRDESLLTEYEDGWKVTKIFPVNSTGVQTSRDNFVIAFSASELLDRISVFRDLKFSDSDIAERFNLKDTREWEMSEARKTLASDENWQQWVKKCLYRPFDSRYIYYTPRMIDWPRPEVMRHMQFENLALCIGRAGQVVGQSYWDIIFCSKSIVDLNLFYRGGNVNFPLYLYSAENEMQFGEGKRRPNLNPDFITTFSDKLELKFVEDGKGDLTETFGPEDIFHYAYAVFHSSTYRTRYAEFLKIDFPRLPLTSDKELFKALAAKGAELVALHLMESPLLSSLITTYPVEGSHEVEKVQYVENDKRVQINKTQYFGNVPKKVWEFHIGGYQVAQKWLKDRKGRKLTVDDINHYQKVIVALRETIRLMAEIDSLIPSWPLE